MKNEKTGEYDLQYRGGTIIPLSRPLDSVTGVMTGGLGGRRVNDPGHTEGHYTMFSDLLRIEDEWNHFSRTPRDVNCKWA